MRLPDRTPGKSTRCRQMAGPRWRPDDYKRRSKGRQWNAVYMSRDLGWWHLHISYVHSSGRMYDSLFLYFHWRVKLQLTVFALH